MRRYAIGSKKRRPVQKSFSGCAKCKARKVKCDETKPHCTRCTSKGLSCPGFPQQRLRWSRKHEFPVEHPDDAEGVSGSSRCVHSEHSEPTNDQAQDLDVASGQVWPESRSPELLPLEFQTIDSLDPFNPHEVNITGGFDDTLTRNPLAWHQPTSVDPIETEPCQTSPVLSAESDRELLEFSTADDTITSHGYQNEPWHLSSRLDEPQDPEAELSSCDSHSTEDLDFQLNPLTEELADFSGQLIQMYFTIVCPRFSTFDSRKNLFRTFVDQTWQSSSAMFYTMLSMSAAKLGHGSKYFRQLALDYQAKAIQSLSDAVLIASKWNTELLLIVLMLGLSACWHNMRDLGIVHLEALRHALVSGDVDMSDGLMSREFFKNALTYWQMVICYAREGGSQPDQSKLGVEPVPGATKNTVDTANQPRHIVPHPWTGIASPQQATFTRVTQLIKQVRSFDQHHSTSTSLLDHPAEYLAAVHAVEEEIWDMKLPGLHEITNTEDGNTPAIHHLLIAEAYMFANMYQLYSIFSNLRERRAKLISGCPDQTPSARGSWAQLQYHPWSSIIERQGGDYEWLKFLGRSIITRLEQIQVNSGTSCLHSFLLLLASTALSTPLEQSDGDEREEILRMRKFVLDRLQCFSAFYMSERVRRVREVVAEIFKRLDVGAQVFWMDVMEPMGVVTIIG